jgi:hypothetical protein
VEDEFIFTMAVGRFFRKAEKEGYFKGQRVGNVKEQLQMRSRQENVGKTKKYVAAVGASEMGLIIEEMEVIGRQVLLVGPVAKVQGDWEEEKMAEVRETMDRCEIPNHYILVGGTGIAIVMHGRAGGRAGMGGKKRLMVEGEGKIRVE